ncbi:class I SAM-dependent methyltransferase [Mucilaginibacter sabulilitoris]|uniref:Class I SAM-dependent methyltransferase n=1 Tax=Mucilaginibacter sabulilitoris TaxID=1173583 RepID=A0ABZ0TFD4_9SPHI|nr:class I SAM-dependent methyltransferase [Mucilaginibacter sabulilitoris]WPU91890.1 class I SAM-dependent methyltransferase [Mucilaginibacter sabulilitoris]
MKQSDAIALISKGITSHLPQHWADLGCGNGTFTNALFHLLPVGSQIEAIDRQTQRLDIPVNFAIANFETDELKLTDLDGIIMANSFHFVQNKKKLIAKMKPCFSGNPTFLIVEYDTDKANSWVPYPLSFLSLCTLFTSLGYHQAIKLAERPSVYNRAKIYAALIQK